MDKKIIVYGAGGHSKVIISLLELLDWEIVGVIDDEVPAGNKDLGAEVLGNASLLPGLRAQGITNIVNSIGGIGHYKVRWDVFEKLRALNFTFPTLIHPTAFVEENAKVADGVQVLAKSYIGAESSVGFGTLINSGTIISHEVKIGRCVNLSPGAMLAGRVQVEDFAQIGMGVTINIGLHIGKEASIGNSAVVKADVPAGGIVHAGEIWPPVHIKKQNIEDITDKIKRHGKFRA